MTISMSISISMTISESISMPEVPQSMDVALVETKGDTIRGISLPLAIVVSISMSISISMPISISMAISETISMGIVSISISCGLSISTPLAIGIDGRTETIEAVETLGGPSHEGGGHAGVDSYSAIGGLSLPLAIGVGAGAIDCGLDTIALGAGPGRGDPGGTNKDIAMQQARLSSGQGGRGQTRGNQESLHCDHYPLKFRAVVPM